jgi:hypothetical protein
MAIILELPIRRSPLMTCLPEIICPFCNSVYFMGGELILTGIYKGGIVFLSRLIFIKLMEFY